MRIEANDLQTAYTEAAAKLNCSVTELKIKVVQHPSKGILGFFKKTAIIDATIEKNEPNLNISAVKNGEKKPKKAKIKKEKPVNLQTSQSGEISQETPKKAEKIEKVAKKEKSPKTEITEEILNEIKNGLNALISASSFAISVVETKKFDDETIYIKLDGEDAALLIGKEGHRYKAFSYMLYNWVSIKYNLCVCLEISEFLQNQEKNLQNYLAGVIQKVKDEGRAYTRPLDGILLKFALEKLRSEFSEKYVAIKIGKNGKFIVINDKNENNV